jgi:small subunit ribosomal protein S7
MPRRYKPERRVIPPDIRYNNVRVQEFINKVIRRGKKSLATRLVYTAFDLIEERTGKNPLEVFEQALNNAAPVMEVRPRRIGGATYQVPVEVPPHRQMSLATRWILTAAKERSGKSFPEKLAAELIDAANNTGNAIRKREETHKMAEANRAFSHYRF